MDVNYNYLLEKHTQSCNVYIVDSLYLTVQFCMLTACLFAWIILPLWVFVFVNINLCINETCEQASIVVQAV